MRRTASSGATSERTTNAPDRGEAADVVARLRDLPGRREIVHTSAVLHVQRGARATPPPPP